ncbi:hypothetical protein PPYR_02825 [Photinus pyralis]|uniref:Choline kinase N-terminal domain-containing protein n=1 Tax=Photinus pyralis TaxID=7054 RepID=A0A5N4A121_PHOPY|nr:choline/ethanolamine kinase isoform X1 [Photinus pyralis]KAB0791025.1 hypothetical protein PPYR_02825 [Photinus pyralis]
MTHWSIRKMSGDNSEMRELAARICRDYLHGAWKHVNAQNIGFKHISGGLSNLLYYISLPDTLPENVKEEADPKEVLIRVYGQTHGERALEALITESVIFTLLSERGLGPKLHGIFPGGRIEQYVNARPLKTKELADEHLSMTISQRMAAIHSMEVPLHKTPGWLWDTMERWLKSSEERFSGDVPAAVKHLKEMSLRREFLWLKQRLQMENSPVVFCHNDMQEGNILMIEDDTVTSNADAKLVLIDFEYCSYNYRAFDIANHFLEWTYDYTEKQQPYFKVTPENYPSNLQRIKYICHYLKETGSAENPLDVLREVEIFSLASHFFWALWSIVNTKSSQITFGYWEYAVERLNAYNELKTRLHKQGIKRKADGPY